MPISKSFQLIRYRVLRARGQRGISLLQLVGIVGALMALVIGLNYKTVDVFTKGRALDSDALLRMADNQLRQYIVANGRLPCPSFDGAGISASSCLTTSQQKGYLPYKTLGMADKNYVFGEVPMLYGAHSEGAISFASSAQVFIPKYADQNNSQQDFVTTTRNMFDFCASLAALKAQSTATMGLAVAGNSEVHKAVYALALPGQGNRDGLSAGWTGGLAVNAQYDGLNATSPNRFELPQAPITPTYDDRTQYRTASDLHDYFRCEAMNSSVNLLTEAVTMQKQTEDFANSNAESVKSGLLMNAALNGLSLLAFQQGNAQRVSAAATLVASTALLAGVTASCAIPPWATCALIPVYTVAVSSATTGGTLSIASMAAAAVGLGLKITATALYAELNGRTTTPNTIPAAAISTVSDDVLTRLHDAYVASKALATTAYLAVPASAPDVSALNAIQQGKAATLAGDVAALTDGTLQGLLNARLNGSVQTCALASATLCSAAGFTAHGDNTLVANYTKDLLVSTAYTPGVIPSLDSYYQALLRSGASTSIGATSTSTSTDPSVMAAQTALTEANAALAAVPVIDPVTALVSSNAVVTQYDALLAAISDFDAKHLADKAASTVSTGIARSTSLSNLRALMGGANSTWDYLGSTTLCGGGSTSVSSCGWMTGATPSAGSSTTRATTRSSTVNDYLAAYGNYKNTAIYQKLKDAADAKASSAWSDRNGYKTANCAKLQSVTWLGGNSTTSTNPADWDVSEKLLDSPITGLSCTNSVAAPDFSVAENAARQAEIDKYCTNPIPSFGDADRFRMCSLAQGVVPAQSSVKGARNVVDALIEKGIVR